MHMWRMSVRTRKHNFSSKNILIHFLKPFSELNPNIEVSTNGHLPFLSNSSTEL